MSLWDQCKKRLKSELSSSHFVMWIQPLQVEASDSAIRLLAPNRFVVNWVKEKYLPTINVFLQELAEHNPPTVSVEVGSVVAPAVKPVAANDGGAAKVKAKKGGGAPKGVQSVVQSQDGSGFQNYHQALNKAYTFSSFVEGKSNQLAKAAAVQVAGASQHSSAYNPLFVYGGVGLGKTHLMHAIGNQVLEKNPRAKVVYLHSERFVHAMIRALRSNSINDFKNYYRSVDVLLIDDIQFFAGKERSQEEFFHTFNALLESQRQIVMTADSYPKEISGLEERLTSRLGWGLTVAIEPPELETRVAILLRKAEVAGVVLGQDAAFLMAKRICSNVRELEGALTRVIAHAKFTGESLSVDLVKAALKDLFALQDRLVTVDNIQKTVAAYYKIKVSELSSAKRTRSLARPRQLAMALAKELTNRSLPEIGEAFGGRDHTTVLHACRKMKELRASVVDIEEDYVNLRRLLSS